MRARFPALAQQRRGEYAFNRDKLPTPGANLEWKEAPSFRAAKEMMRDAGLKNIVETAIAEGFAIVAPPSTTDWTPRLAAATVTGNDRYRRRFIGSQQEPL